jgi:PIN domain nuclease of toxin-antitoxin system
MRILLDTQSWLWMVSAPDRLSAASQALVADADTELLLSAASAWEIAIKESIGKLTLPEPAERYVPSRLASFRTASLPISHNHALRVGVLPMHHRDPFDRILIAQAQIEGLPLLTGDPRMARYDVELISA